MTEDNEQNAIYHRIDDTDTLVLVSETWLPFAEVNGAPHLKPEQILGQSIWKYIGDRTTKYLCHLLLARLRDQPNTTITIPLRFDAPAIRRYLELVISAVEDGHVDFTSWLVRAGPRQSVALLNLDTPRSQDIFTMCGWCNKCEIAADEWLEVEDAVSVLKLCERQTLPRLTHGMCPSCKEARNSESS